MRALLILFLLAAAVSAAADDQITQIKKTIGKTPVAELPAVVGKLVKNAAAADRDEIAKVTVQVVKAQRPGALTAVMNAIPAANRPTVTPGNEHGNRPEVPPGLARNYASP